MTASIATHPHVRWLVQRAETAERERDALRRQLNTDHLTCIANRRGLEQRFTLHPHGTVASALMVDVDQFKTINDTHGHRTGDLVLCHVAKQLHRCAEPGDLPARVSGDEFVLWLRPTTSITTARERAEQQAARLQDTIPTGHPSVTAAVGIGVIHDPTRLEDVLMPADTDMYRHKTPHAA